MIADLQNILKTVIYAPPPHSYLTHDFNILPTRVMIRKGLILELWPDIKQKKDNE